MNAEGLIIAGTQSSSGKTAITSMLLAALKKRGIAVQPFKVGPDFIDPGYHRTYSGMDSVNLDSWIMGETEVRKAARNFTKDAVGIAEGVMGLFDGANPDNDEGSSMEIARWLNWPVLLVVNCAQAGRSVIASIRGYLDEAGPECIAGVILNRLGSEGHVKYLEKACVGLEVPVLGLLPKISELEWTERHLGLQASQEQELPSIERIAELADRHLDLPGILDLLLLRPTRPKSMIEASVVPGSPKKRIGVALDEAFHFYYRANLEWLQEEGAEAVAFSPLNDPELPKGLDGLILGGGFPEVYAEQMSGNRSMIASLKKAQESGMPCYAECGGLMLLAEEMETKSGSRYPMVGSLPGTVKMMDHLQHFGYCSARLDNGKTFRGHEFHYSTWTKETSIANAWMVQRHANGSERIEGYKKAALHASYVHLYFPNSGELISPLLGLCT